MAHTAHLPRGAKELLSVVLLFYIADLSVPLGIVLTFSSILSERALIA